MTRLKVGLHVSREELKDNRGSKGSIDGIECSLRASRFSDLHLVQSVHT